MTDLMSQVNLPSSSWSSSFSDCVNVSKIVHSPRGPLLLLNVTIYEDLTWEVHVAGKSVKRDCIVLQKMPTILSVRAADDLLNTLESSIICPGNPDSAFIALIESRKGSLLSPNGKEASSILDSSVPVKFDGVVHEKTVRSTTCQMLTTGRRCSECVKYRNVLRKINSRWEKSNNDLEHNASLSSSHANDRYLRSPQKKLKMSAIRKELSSARRLVRALQRQIERDGISVEPLVQDDLAQIAMSAENAVQKECPDGSLKKLFWNQQVEALRKNPKQMRWHPAFIRWCLYIRLKSSGAYTALRDSGVLRLPSERTLFDYTHWTRAAAGFHETLDVQLIAEANVRAEKDKYVVVAFDEMKIKENLVFDKHGLNLVGFTNLGEFENGIQRLEERCKAEGATERSREPAGKITTHMLAFMVRGLFSTLEFPYAHFATTGATAVQLYPIVWDVVKHLERCGLRVMALVCDGAATNRKFFGLHSSAGDEICKTRNPYSEQDRDIYFMFDVPHLLKTARNCWSNSFAHRFSRKLWVSVSQRYNLLT